jgi:hypothetical protein
VVVPNQLPGLADRVGLTRGNLDRSVWLVDPFTGQKWSGAAAVTQALDEVGGAWAALGQIGRFPGIRALLAIGYQWIADHRSLLGRLWTDQPFCETSEQPCGSLR